MLLFFLFFNSDSIVQRMWNIELLCRGERRRPRRFMDVVKKDMQRVGLTEKNFMTWGLMEAFDVLGSPEGNSQKRICTLHTQEFE